ncbi:hypothetical protein E2C01_046219 [Portunus trituberculatus]|uniref:Uncharacterized protein n=1 Tax=Portunus trituberculatus TaxID=210409 RepID=A0A5B7FXV4_PORTR|nr:hypothetical protein [Portunus trituberculatus]
MVGLLAVLPLRHDVCFSGNFCRSVCDHDVLTATLGRRKNLCYAPWLIYVLLQRSIGVHCASFVRILGDVAIHYDSFERSSGNRNLVTAIIRISHLPGEGHARCHHERRIKSCAMQNYEKSECYE